MAQVLVRNLSEDVVLRLKQRASNLGISLEEELRIILTDAAKPDMAEFINLAASIRSKNRPDQKTDSVDLIREDRDR